MESPKWLVDLSGIVGSGAGVLAVVIALLMYLYPLTNDRALRLGRITLLSCCISVCLGLIWHKGWLQQKATLPLWAGLAGIVVMILISYGLTKLRERQYKVPAYANMAGMRWPIIDQTVWHEPICEKCNVLLKSVVDQAPGIMRWRCDPCNKDFTWDTKEKRAPQDAAAETVNSRYRARNLPAPVKGAIIPPTL